VDDNPALDDARRLFYRAHAYLLKNQLSEAIPFFSEALDLYPELFCARIGLAVCLARLRRFEQAIQVCLDGISLDEENRVHQYLLYLTLGDIFMLQGDYEKAEGAFLHALKYSTQPETALSRIGVVRCKRGDFSGGWDMFLRAARINIESE